MAIAVGDRVRPSLVSSTLSVPVNPEPPVLGVVTFIQAGSPDVIFATIADNGITWSINASTLQPAGVPADALDQITPVDSPTREAFIDKVVLGLTEAQATPFDPSTEFSAEYTGIVVDVYLVNGTATVLIRCLANGMYYELPTTRVVIIGDR